MGQGARLSKNATWCAPALNPGARRSRVIHKRHHIGRVAFTDDRDLREAGLDLFQVAFSELYFERSHVLLEIVNALRAGDRDEVMALSKNPREGQLSRGRALLAGELFYGFHQFKVGLQGLLSETRVGTAPITAIKILEFLDRAG